MLILDKSFEIHNRPILILNASVKNLKRNLESLFNFVELFSGTDRIPLIILEASMKLNGAIFMPLTCSFTQKANLIFFLYLIIIASIFLDLKALKGIWMLEFPTA